MVGEGLGRRTVLTLVVAALLTGVLAWGVAGLEFATGQDSYLDASSDIAQDNERYQSLFGGETMVVLFTMAPGHTVVDLFSAANRETFAAVEAELEARPVIEAVVSPVGLLTWTQDMVASGVATEILTRTAGREPNPDAAALRQQDLALTATRLAAAGEQTLDNPTWVEFLVYGNDGFTLGPGGELVAPSPDELVVRRPLQAFIRDSEHVIFAAVLVGNSALDELAAGSSAVQEAFAGHAFEHAELTVTGTPTFLTEINDYLQGGMLVLGAIAVLVMIVILVVAFKVRWRLLPLLGMVVGVVWGFGAFGFTGTTLSLVTIAGLPILIGMGIEFAIQVQNRIEEERARDRSPDPFGETLARMGPPLLAAAAAAVIAFLTMRISKVPMVQDFGVLLSIGIIALLVAGVVLPTTIIGARERRRPSVEAPAAGWVEATVRFLGALPRGALLPLVVLAVALPVVGLALEGDTRIESDPINWADQSSRTIEDARRLEDETGMATTLGVFIETQAAGGSARPANGTFTDQMGAFVVDLVARAHADNAEIVGVSSLPTTVGWLTDVAGAPSIPPTGRDLLLAYEVAPPALQRTLVAEDGAAAQILFQLGPSSLEARADVLARIDRAIADPGGGALLPANASATTGGLAVVGVGLLDNITANRSALTIVALVLVAAFLVLVHRDLVRGVLTMIPVLLAVGTSAVLVRVLDITLSPLTTVGGPLVVATCAEFSVLLMDRYAEERQRGSEGRDATRLAAEHTGRAFFTSALTTLGGFAVLMFSPLPLLADFGMVVTVNIGVAVLSALVVIPPLVTEADRRGWLDVRRLDSTRAVRPGWRRPLGWAAGLALAVAGLAMAALAIGSDDPVAAEPRRTAAAEEPAELPAPTTTAVATTTVAATTTASPGGSAPGPDGGLSAPTPPAAETLAPGPPERPVGLVAGAFWDALTGAGVDPGVARCAADDLIATTSEAELLALGVANVPRPAEVDALLADAGARCGITDDQLAVAAG
jgi:hydrophobe/amphiphile efflux-3 (HAE3) family protein